jgi:DNA-binding CsgD family transcriptional regulator
MFDDEKMKIIDRAYEAAVVPEMWPQLCDVLSSHIGAYSTALITFPSGGAPRWVSSECIAEQMRVYEESGLAQRNDRPTRGLQQGLNTFLRDVDLLTAKELERDPIRAELLEPLGLAWEMGASFLEPSGSIFVFSQLQKTEDGPFSIEATTRMNALKPDLARAAFLATRLRLKQASSMTEGLALIGLAGAVIGDGGQILSANQQFLDLSPRIRSGAYDRVYFSDNRVKTMYADALTHMRGGRTAVTQSIPIVPQDDEPALVIQMIPVRRSARDIFNKSCAMLVITPVGKAGPPDMRVICGLFDLTRTEAAVAQKLTGGQSVSQVSIELGISQETVRTHLKSLFRKTGVNRQAQLVRLLAGLGPATEESGK